MFESKYVHACTNEVNKGQVYQSFPQLLLSPGKVFLRFVKRQNHTQGVRGKQRSIPNFSNKSKMAVKELFVKPILWTG